MDDDRVRAAAALREHLIARCGVRGLEHVVARRAGARGAGLGLYASADLPPGHRIVIPSALLLGARSHAGVRASAGWRAADTAARAAGFEGGAAAVPGSTLHALWLHEALRRRERSEERRRRRRRRRRWRQQRAAAGEMESGMRGSSRCAAWRRRSKH